MKQPPMTREEMEEARQSILSEAMAAIKEIQEKWGDEAAEDFARGLAARFTRKADEWLEKIDKLEAARKQRLSAFMGRTNS